MRTAAEIAAAVHHGEVTAVEVTRQALDRIAAAEPQLNAFTAIQADQALARAAAVDARRAAGTYPGPLAGVPVALKDLVDQVGEVTTAGSSFHRHLADRSAPAVARLEAAGAVIVGRTGLHEFAFGFSSENHWFGPVRNPVDPALSSGGSSGGSAAAVGGGVVPLAVGTDTGGSVRVPAALCGVVGLKVQHGRVPLDGVFPLVPSLDTVGPIGRTVGDVLAGYEALAGTRLDAGPAGLAGLRVVVPHPWVDAPLATGLGDAFRQALDALADAGAEVTDAAEPLLDYPGELAAAIAPEVIDTHRRWFPARRDEYGPDVAERLDAALAVTAAEADEARRWRRDVHQAFDRVLAGDRPTIVATPAVAARRKVIGVDTVEVGGRAVPYRPELSRFSALVNQAGLPALALPVPEPARPPATPPASLQLVGPAGGEALLLGVGLALEATGIALEVLKSAEDCI